MDISKNITNTLQIDSIKIHKMAFIYNALEEGWRIVKKNDMYVFTKNHEGKKEVFLDNYLAKFLENNFDINKIINQL
uniref:Uncharacterized protein n=1 Tax=viral metagenome TaxID=1070528 RepID=A0A6C0C5Y8_9ZZZZ